MSDWHWALVNLTVGAVSVAAIIAAAWWSTRRWR